MKLPVIAITPGEPAGIGPDIVLQLAARRAFEQQAKLVVIGNASLMHERAQQLQLSNQIEIIPTSHKQLRSSVRQSNSERPTLSVLHVDGYATCPPGQPNAKNARYILDTLTTATRLCQESLVDALVTGPVNKHYINVGLGNPSPSDQNFFSGHTEYLAQLTHTDTVVMMLAGQADIAKDQILRVALVTTHLPLHRVSENITANRLEYTLRILHEALQSRWGIARPQILVCGLNPHAGEEGDLGSEEVRIINPVLKKLQAEGFNLSEAMPADTLFTASHLGNADAVLAMYHDQGLPVLKSHCFGRAANITLGLPIVRTSVDHGTAFDLAGSGQASTGSLETAIQNALAMSTASLAPANTTDRR